MIESIKITNLNNIGSNLSYTSIFPVVDMSGTPVTDKANLQIIGNYILSQAGGANFVQAAQATLAQTVVNAAQPNITSVGTLTALTVSGNLNISVSNLKVSGGTNGYVLQTDGNGNLTWTAQTGGGGNGSPGGANTQIQFNDAGLFGGDSGLTYNKTTDTLTTVNINAGNIDLTGNVSANWVIGDYVSGNAHNLFYIPGANINGTVANATVAATVTTAAQPNITSVGTLSNLTVTGNVSANYFVGTATEVVVEAVNNNYSYHMAFITGEGDTTLHMDNDDNLQYNPAEGIMTVNRVDMGYLSVSQSVISNLNPFSNVTQNLGNNTNRWNDLYLANSTIYLGDATISANGNSIVVDSITVTNGNVGTIGNIASLNLTGSSSNVLYGNGVFAPASGGGANTGNVTFDDINIIGTGNLHLQPDPANTSSYLDIFLTSGPDLHLVASAAANLILGKDDGPNVMTSWDGNVYVQSWNTGSNTQGGVWNFGEDGNLTAPGAINVGNMVIGTVPGDITADANTGVTFNVSGPDGGFAVNYLDEVGNANTSGGELAFSSETGNATYRISLSDDLGDGFATKIWRFDGTGNLTLPGNTFAVNYANGTQVSLGGGGNTGNVTFNDQVIQGTGDEYGGSGLYLAPGTNSTANLQFLRVRGGDYPTHIHLDTGNNNYFDQYFGADFRYVKLEANGNIVINADDDNGNSATWTFDTTGNLVLANGNSVISSIANSSLDPLNPNVSTMTLTPDANYSGQALVLDPTAPGHIHLRSPAYSSNIDEPVANLFLGGEASSFEVGVSYSGPPNVYVHSNNYTWTYGTDGNLTLPGLPGTYIKGPAGGYAGLAVIDDGTDLPAQLVSINSNSGLGTTAISAYANNALIQANINGDIKSWNFDNTGNLTLPGNTFAVNYANGTQVSLGGGLPLSNGTSNVDIAASNGNVTITANGTSTWTFDTAGNLNTPGSLLPSSNGNYDLGSNANRWRDLYLSGNTIYLGPNVTLQSSDDDLLLGTPNIDLTFGGGAFTMANSANANNTFSIALFDDGADILVNGNVGGNLTFGGGAFVAETSQIIGNVVTSNTANIKNALINISLDVDANAAINFKDANGNIGANILLADDDILINSGNIGDLIFKGGAFTIANISNANNAFSIALFDDGADILVNGNQGNLTFGGGAFVMAANASIGFADANGNIAGNILLADDDILINSGPGGNLVFTGGAFVANTTDLRIGNTPSAIVVPVGVPSPVATKFSVVDGTFQQGNGDMWTDGFLYAANGLYTGNGLLLTSGNINFSNGSQSLIAYGANNYINMNNDGGMDLSCNTEVKITTNYGDAPNRAYSYFYSNGTFSTGTIVATGNITGGNIIKSSVTDYANLPAATTAGLRAFISDANLVASGNFGATVGSGGSNTVPVYSDGSNWRIG